MFSANQEQRLWELIQLENTFGVSQSFKCIVNLFLNHFGTCWKEKGYLKL